jgi:hypothetical protein
MTAPRRRHILERHPEVAVHLGLVAETIREPDAVRRSRWDEKARVLHRWYPACVNGKHLVVVVRLAPGRARWGKALTAYLTSRAPKGALEWKRS